MKANRQRVVLGDRATSLDVAISEGALRQTAGPPRVTRDQLARLASVADTGLADALPGAGGPGQDRSHVSLRVLPFAAGALAAAGCGPVTLLRFAETQNIGVVHLPALSGGVSLDGRDELARYHRAFAQLRSAALSTSRSAHLIRAMARTCDR